MSSNRAAIFPSFPTIAIRARSIYRVSISVVYDLPPLHDPVMHASAVRQRPGGGASYFTQLQSALAFVWVEVDVASGAQLANSSYPVEGHLPLAMTIYVPGPA